jgi:tetratricopeptide (TPR) repeat protein
MSKPQDLVKSGSAQSPSGVPRLYVGLIVFLALVACGAAFWVHWGRGRDLGAPVPPGRIGLFIAAFEGPAAAEQTEALVAALRVEIGGSDSQFQTWVETRELPRAIDRSSLADGRAAEWAERLNAGVIFAGPGPRGEKGEIAPAVLLRLPGAVSGQERADLQRLRVRVAYPTAVLWPRAEPAAWAMAARLARIHLLTAAGLSGAALDAAALDDLQVPPETPEWADWRHGAGSLALATAILGRADSTSLGRAIEYLRSARQGFVDDGRVEAATRSGINLASALRLRSGADGAEALEALRLLMSMRKDILAMSDTSAQALGCFQLVAAWLDSTGPSAGSDAAPAWPLDLLDRAQRRWERQLRSYAWAATQALRARVQALRGGPGANAAVEEAIETLQSALEVLTVESFPGEWADGQVRLAALYERRAVGTRSDNLSRSRQCYTNALSVWSPETSLEPWARALIGRAAVLVRLDDGAPEENLRQAIADCERALEAVERQSRPRLWADIHNLMGVASRRRGGGDEPGRFRESIGHFNAALEVRLPRQFPVECAQTLSNLGNAYRDFPDPANQRHYLEQAVRAYDAALAALAFGRDLRIRPRIEQNRDRAVRAIERLAGPEGDAP